MFRAFSVLCLLTSIAVAQVSRAGYALQVELAGRAEIQAFMTDASSQLDEKNELTAIRNQLGFVLDRLEYVVSFDRSGTFMLGKDRFASLKSEEKALFRTYFAEQVRQIIVIRLVKARQEQLAGIQRLLDSATAREMVGISVEELQALQSNPMNFEVSRLKEAATFMGPGFQSTILGSPELTLRMIAKNLMKREDVELVVEFVVRDGVALFVDALAGGARPVRAEMDALRSYLRGGSAQEATKRYAEAITRKFSLSPAHVAILEELSRR